MEIWDGIVQYPDWNFGNYLITYWIKCVFTDNANTGVVCNGEDSGHAHMDYSGRQTDESHTSSFQRKSQVFHSGENGRL